MDDIILKLKIWLSQDSVDSIFENNADWHCQYRNIFQFRQDQFRKAVNDPLLAAVVGEIGNNSFDHNFARWKDVVGVFFIYDLEKRIVIIADRGQGVKATLIKVKPDIKDDEEAVKVAFTQILSGRAPEQRGNGLKFSASVVQSKNWNLFLQSGKGCVVIENDKIAFESVKSVVNGCLTVIRY
jgi:sensor histidine kinase regulating citrate/malate metabolism